MHSISNSQFGLGYRRSLDAAVQGTPIRFVLDGENDPPPTKTYTQAELDAAVSGLKSKNTELLGKVVKFKDLPDDATPDEIKAAIEFKRSKEKEELEATGKYDELTRQMGESHTTEKRTLEEKIGHLSNTIVSREKNLAAKDAIRELEGKEKWLLPHILPQLAVEEDGDDYSVYVVDKKGNAVMNSDGTKKTVKQALAELRDVDEWKDAFLAPDVAGGGARGGAGRQQSNGDVVLTGVDARDPQKYRQAKELAEKNGGRVIIR